MIEKAYQFREIFRAPFFDIRQNTVKMKRI